MGYCDWVCVCVLINSLELSQLAYGAYFMLSSVYHTLSNYHKQWNLDELKLWKDCNR